MAVADGSDSSSEYSDIDEREAREEADSDSDAELQRKFAKGELTPGLHKIKPKSGRQYINDVNGLKRKLEDFTLTLPWIERFDITSEMAPLAPELDVEIAQHGQTSKQPKSQKAGKIKPGDDVVHDDFKREMMFYRQGQAAVMEGYSRLKALELPTVRPEDYFAEMAKSDEHMKKVRRRLAKRQIGREISERVKKIREMKKFGKKVQVEVEMQKQKEKKEMMDKIKKFRKRKTNTIDFLEDKNGPMRSKQSGPQSPFHKKQNAKKTWKDKKYGFGGRKKNMKRNTSSDVWNDNLPPMRKSKGGHQQKQKQKGRVKNVNRNKKSKNKGRGRR